MYQRVFIVFFIVFSFVLGQKAMAQNARKVKATIKTSAECIYCKQNIEKSLGKVKGIRKVSCDYVKHEVYVVFNSKKTSIEKIRTELNLLGYDADDQKANFDKFKNTEHNK